MDYKDRHTQDTAVRGDQRKEYAQRLVKGGRDLLQYDFHHLYQCCNDKDKCNSLQIFQPESIEYKFLDKIGNNGSDGKHECNSRTHTRSCLNFFGYTEERADTQEL